MENYTTSGLGHNTPNDKPHPSEGHDDLLAEVLEKHASPEQQEAALQERIERESAVLREFLGTDVPEGEGRS